MKTTIYGIKQNFIIATIYYGFKKYCNRNPFKGMQTERYSFMYPEFCVYVNRTRKI